MCTFVISYTIQSDGEVKGQGFLIFPSARAPSCLCLHYVNSPGQRMATPSQQWHCVCADALALAQRRHRHPRHLLTQKPSV